MNRKTQYDDPNDIDSMSTLKIQALSGNISPKIYANGRNQLPIEITAKALNKDDKVMNFSHKDWIHILNLCFAESNDKLSWKNRSGWCFSDEKNDYSKEIEVASPQNTLFNVKDDGTVIIIMYVYTDEIEIKRIAVRVDTDNKHFTTADNASGAEKMSVTVEAIPAIDYGLPQNVTLSGMPKKIDDFSKVVCDMAIRRGLRNPEETVWNIGISSKVKFTIKPALIARGYVFKLVNPIRNNANLSSCNFPNNIKPDMIRGTGGGNFDAQFVFVNQKTYGLNPNSKINVLDNSSEHGYLYHYEIGVNDNRHYWQEKLDNGSITVDICNHRIPWHDIIKYEWEDQGKLITVNVIDNYGNSGAVKIEAPNDEHLWPILYVNGGIIK